MSTSALVGIGADAEARPDAGAVNPVLPGPPRRLLPCTVVADYGGPPAGRVVMVRFQDGAHAFRTLGRPAAYRPDWN